MIKETTGYLPKENISKGKGQLFYRLFEPDSKIIKGSLLILHGMQEHSGRYIEFARFICKQGYVVMCYDHIGHGLTAKNEDDLGFFTLKNPALRLIDDAEYMTLYLERLYSNIQHFILGHSMGSFILRLLIERVNDAIDGAIMVGTGNKNPMAGFAEIYLEILNIVSPKKRSKFINKSFEKMNNRKFKNDSDTSHTRWLSVNKSNREAFLNDKLNGVPFTNNGFYALISLNVNATKRDWSKNIDKTLPLLFVSGGDDPIGNFGKGVKSTVDNLRKNGFVNVELNVYEGMRHEILNEDIKEQVYDDILNWLSEQMKL